MLCDGYGFGWCDDGLFAELGWWVVQGVAQVGQ